MITVELDINRRQQLTYLWFLCSLQLLNHIWVDLSFFFHKNTHSFSTKQWSLIFKKTRKHLKSETRFLELKSLYNLKTDNILNNVTSKKSPNVVLQPNEHYHMIPLFKIFLNTSTDTNTSLMKMNPSWVAYYFYVAFGDSCIVSVRKFFTRWKRTYYLLFNLFYYNINLLTFGTSFFKKELLALNWRCSNSLTEIWRYVSPFFYFKVGKIFDEANYLFHKLRLLGLNIAFIVDISYHKKTLYYLNNSSFYTIGVVPLNLNMNLVNFAIPAAAESLFTQLFFLRFVLNIQKKSKAHKYGALKKLWFNFHSRF